MEPQLKRAPDYSEMGRKSVQARRVAAVERRIKELVDSAPPISEEQRTRLATALRGAPA